MGQPNFPNVLVGAKLLSSFLIAPKALIYIGVQIPCGHGNVPWHQLEGSNPAGDTGGDTSANRNSWEGISYN